MRFVNYTKMCMPIEIYLQFQDLITEIVLKRF